MKTPPAVSSLAIIALVSLGAAVSPARSETYNWTASQNRGSQWDCSEQAENVIWKITETADSMVVLSDDTGRFHIHARHLKPDGSGRLDFTDTKGKPLWLDFDPGHGARKIRLNWGNHACVWTLEPK